MKLATCIYEPRGDHGLDENFQLGERYVYQDELIDKKGRRYVRVYPDSERAPGYYATCGAGIFLRYFQTGVTTMGYTHYWNFEPATLKNWETKLDDVEKIVSETDGPYELDREFDDDKQLALNGPNDARDLNHETFAIPRTLKAVKERAAEKRKQWPKDESMWGFDCCKTAQKPYDAVVITACLCVLAETGLKVSSDGSQAEWEPGRALAQAILGRPVANPIQDE